MTSEPLLYLNPGKLIGDNVSQEIEYMIQAEPEEQARWIGKLFGDITIAIVEAAAVSSITSTPAASVIDDFDDWVKGMSPEDAARYQSLRDTPFSGSLNASDLPKNWLKNIDSTNSANPVSLMDRLITQTISDNITTYVNTGKLSGLGYIDGYTQGMIAKQVGMAASILNPGATASAMGDLLESPALNLLKVKYNIDDTVANTLLYGNENDIAKLMGRSQFEVDMIATEIAAMLVAPKATVASVDAGGAMTNFFNGFGSMTPQLATVTGSLTATAGSVVAVGGQVVISVSPGALGGLEIVRSVSEAGGGGLEYDKEKLVEKTRNSAQQAHKDQL